MPGTMFADEVEKGRVFFALMHDLLTDAAHSIHNALMHDSLHLCSSLYS